MNWAWKLTLRIVFPFLILFFCGVGAQEQDKPAGKPVAKEKDKDAPPAIKGLPKINDALALALKDASQFDELTRFRLRYIWEMNGDKEAGQAIARTLNNLSLGSVLIRPVALGNGPLLVFRVDLLSYAPREADFLRFDDAWEELRFDPRINLLLTKQTIEFAAKALIGQPNLIRRTRDGHKIVENQVRFEDIKDTKLLRVLAPHVDVQLLTQLEVAVGSTAPLVTADYFIARSMASIKDANLFDGLYALIYGGLYYDFAGVPQKTKDATDLDKLLEQLGIGDTKNKVKSDQVFDKLRSDKRVAMFRSKVAAGRPRRVDFLPTIYGSVFDSRRFVAITHDLKRANIDIGANPILNLLKLETKADAHEVIWTKTNGLLGYALYNGDEAIQEKAPDDVVNDYTVPAPFYRELQTPISCIACHEAEFAHGGWQPVVNDVRRLLAPRLNRADVLDDINGKDNFDTIDRLAGLYTGEAETLLREARAEHEQAVLRATGPWKKSADQTDVVQFSGKKIVQMWRSFFYDDITPKRALRELGWDCPTDDLGKITLEALLRPNPDAEVAPNVAIEDARIAALRAGIAIDRSSWDLIYPFVAVRIQKALQNNPALLKGAK